MKQEEIRQLQCQRWFYFWGLWSWCFIRGAWAPSVTQPKGRVPFEETSHAWVPVLCETGNSSRNLGKNLWKWIVSCQILTDWKTQVCLCPHHHFRFEMESKNLTPSRGWVCHTDHVAPGGGFSPTTMTTPPHILPYGLGVTWKEVLFIKQPGKQFRPHAQNLIFSAQMNLLCPAHWVNCSMGVKGKLLP